VCVTAMKGPSFSKPIIEVQGLGPWSGVQGGEAPLRVTPEKRGTNPAQSQFSP